MNVKTRLDERFRVTRAFTDKLLAAFRTPEDWVYQVQPHLNHALWVVGHLAHTDNFFLSMVAPEKAVSPPPNADKFGTGSQPTNNPADYPPAEEVLAYYRDRRAALLSALERMSEDDLQRKTPPGTPAFLPDVASAFETALWHECMHSGQLTVVRRALGLPPLEPPAA
ncbi:MAG TPA: DinB family protein [Pirellulales bacterium]